MCRPTRLPYRGRLKQLGEVERSVPWSSTGVLAAACTQESVRNTGSPMARSAMTNRTPARTGRAPWGWRRRFAVPRKPGNSGGGKGPQFKTDAASAVQRRRFPVGASPTRQSLQPEAIGAVMEVTKWLKPSISVSRIGDSASVQAATRVNVEQASKRKMCRPTRLPYRGRLKQLGELSEAYAQLLHRGSGGGMCTRKCTQHGKPHGEVSDDQ